MNISVNRTGKTYGPDDIQLLMDRIKRDTFRNVCYSLESELLDVLNEFKTILEFNPQECVDEAMKRAKMTPGLYQRFQWPRGLLANLKV